MAAGSFNPPRVLLATLQCGCALLAAAETIVQRSPPDAPNTTQTRLGSGLQSLNLEDAAFVSGQGVTIVSKSQADDGNGVIRVYSAIDSRGVSGMPDALTGSALGQVLANGTLAGPAGGAAVDVSFVFDFDGRLRIELPAGYSLAGREGLLTSTVSTTPVPEPGTWALYAAGMLALPWLARRRRG